ncbi:DUF1697 domain-containing protein [Pseudonocardia lacus]|uniref:DUF1697 domain-containing protein n=1 Tax=Pseudonocardia lacus TaxID=2835865 RepID=UPI001BDD8F2D|nr:DUF1697 domain-containing protein [Pseudonocardia lacus]
MPRYALLLRGINLGPRRRVAMADLRSLLEGAGYTEVRTHLQSGNAVLTGPEADPVEHERRISAAIEDALGMDVRCVVLTADELRAVVDGHPFADVADNGSRMMAHVLAEQPDDAQLAAHDPTALDPENSRLGPRVIYQWCPDGLMGAPPVGGSAEKHWKIMVTARNWNTMTKLVELIG